MIERLLRHRANVKECQAFHAFEQESGIIQFLELLLVEDTTLNTTMCKYHCDFWRLYLFMGLGNVLHKATMVLEEVCTVKSLPQPVPSAPVTSSEATVSAHENILR